MSSSLDNLSACTSPLTTAAVFNPTRPQYYLKDVSKAAPAPTPAPAASPAVTVTLSDAAKNAMAAQSQA